MHRPSRPLILIVLVSVAGLLGLVAPSPAGAAAPSVVVTPGHSIQAALNAAPPNTTIVVRPGTYHENLTIRKDGTRLVGLGATLLPPATPKKTPCADSSNPTAVNGICIAGRFVNGNMGPIVHRRVHGVHVIGFTVRNFSETGIFAVASVGTRILFNTLIGNGGYGIFANTAIDTTIAYNHTANSAEAGIYIGDSPHADAKVFANDSSGNLFGVFVRNAEHGVISGNHLHGNCVGAIFLADAPGPAGAFRAISNHVDHNNKVCPPGADAPVPLSGIGFAIAGAHNVTIERNLINNNVPGTMVPFGGGVVVVTGNPMGTAPARNAVRGNVLRNNSPDIFSDGSGAHNVFSRNVCTVGVPAGLCHG